MKKFFTFLLYLLVILLICGIVIGIYMLIGRPLEEAGVVIGVIFGVWLLIILIRKLIVRYRAKAQVERVIKISDVVDAELGKSPKELLKDLQVGWKKAIKTLRGSHLKLKGDPLYVLPWYMVFGKPRSGKSTALKNASLLMPSLELSSHTDGSTLNLEWWLYDQAIVIDTAGRYAVPDDDKRDRKEWGSLLNMLTRHKQKEPINGLVIVVAADRLLNNTHEELLEEGRQVRSGINELMEKLEVKMPVYLMVTKCDLIDQFTNWCKYLPEESRKQVMGYLYEDEVLDVDSSLDKAFDVVLDRLKELRLLMMERTDSPDDSLIELPFNMEKLRDGLHSFSSTALKANLYQESPKLRGLYFSSSQHDVSEEGSSEIKNEGLFLHHLFTRIMPPDRGILSTLPSAERLRRAARNYGLSGAGLTIAAAVLMMSFAFVKDQRALEFLLSKSTEIQMTQSDVNEQINSLYRLSELIKDVNKVENEWTLPWYGISSHSPQYLAMVDKFTQTFRNELLDQVDHNLNLRVSTVSESETAYLVSGLVRRINILNEKLIPKDEKDEEPTILPDIPDEYLSVVSDNVDADSSQLFVGLYKKYITLISTNVVLEEEQLRLKTVLEGSLYSGRTGFNWLILWANSQGLPTVKLDMFWNGSRLLEKQPEVPAAYTLEGRAFLSRFLEELKLAVEGSASLSVITSDFMSFYDRKYLKAWKEFAEKFDMGKEKLRGRKEWLTALEAMTGRDNPYFSFMRMAKLETAPITMDGIFNSKESIDYFAQIQDFVGEETGGKGNAKLAKMGLKVLGKFGKVGKLAAKAGKKGLKAKKKMGGGKAVDLDAVLEDASKSYVDYKKALLDISFNADSTKFSYNAISSAYKSPENLSVGDGSGATAWAAIRKLQMTIGKPRDSSRTFWNLYTGPIRLAYDYMQKEAACHLQTSWQDNVLAEVVGVNEDKLAPALIGETGLVWAYVQNYADPFLKKKFRKGYIPNKLNSTSLGWEEEFIKYINNSDEGRSVVGSDFIVKVEALPTGINQGATISPYATYLDLHCADGVQTLANYNYSAAKNFNWSLKNCGDATLRIEVGEYTLRIQYKGRKGFSKFLADFRDGRRIFAADEFPEYASQLRNESVRSIDVNYKFFGQEPVIQALSTVSLYPPRDAIACWAN